MSCFFSLPAPSSPPCTHPCPLLSPLCTSLPPPLHPMCCTPSVLDPALPTSPFDAAVCSYGSSTGEIGLLQRKRHMKRLRRTVEMLNSGQANVAYSTQRHEQLVRLKHKSMRQQPCAAESCLKTALPLAKYCKLRIPHSTQSNVCVCVRACVCACVRVCVRACFGHYSVLCCDAKYLCTGM